MKPRLVVVTDFSRSGSEHHLRRIAGLVSRAAPGSVLVQLRDHALPTRDRFQLGTKLRQLTLESGQWFVLNDRLDLWKLLGADGVHLGEGSVDSEDARAFGVRWISRSVHGVDVLPKLDADAVLLSPIIEARHGRPALGIGVLPRARELLGGRRVFALGGVSVSTARACLDAGADGVAVVSAALDHDDPAPLLGALDILR